MPRQSWDGYREIAALEIIAIRTQGMIFMKKRRGVALCLGAGILLGFVFDLYIGYYNSYIDHDEHAVYFIKKFPTLKREFVNPFANESDALPVDDLPSDVRGNLFDYCKYAYGLIRNDSKSLEGCRAQIIRETQ